MNIEELSTIDNEEAFKSIVNSDIRNQLDTETYQALRHPEMVRRWFNCLVSIKRNIEIQLAAFKVEKLQKANDDDFTDWLYRKHDWKIGVLRFQLSVEERIAEAKLLLVKNAH